MFGIVALSLFILSWAGAAGAWAVAAYSTLRVWTDGSRALVGRYRARALTAGAVSATFIVTGFLAGMASGLFTHLHA
ncbi:MAG TPA: hypothetical protein VID67_15385 [Rhizomicrobium sp.]